jgi:hypothetical protein
MSGSLRPPPYRPRPKEGEENAAAPKADLELRSLLIRRILVVAGVGALSGVVLLLRELPGGGLPYVLPLPSILLWLVSLFLATIWAGRRDMTRTLVFAILVLGGFSLLGIALSYASDPGFWSQAVLR